MKTLTRQAPAKLNLTLDVLGKREDGYHEMKMVMTSVTLADTVTLASEPGEGIVLSSNLGFLPVDGKNLAVSAALRLKEETGADWGKLTIGLEKRVPVCAGMAGGSSDAAAVLVGLNELLGLGLTRERLMEIGARVGSDVPYCVLAGGGPDAAARFAPLLGGAGKAGLSCLHPRAVCQNRYAEGPLSPGYRRRDGRFGGGRLAGGSPEAFQCV